MPLHPPVPTNQSIDQSTNQGFLQEQGLAVDDGLDGIAAGLQALLGGSSDDEDEEEGDGDGEGGKKAPMFVMETYKRPSYQHGPAELELSLAPSHHSLWGTSCVLIV